MSCTSAIMVDESLSLCQAQMIAWHIQLTNQWEEGNALYIQAGATQEWAIRENEGKRQKTVANIPDKYQWHWRVFDKEASYWFPPKQEDNYAIKLKPGAPDIMDCKVYPLTPQELEA